MSATLLANRTRSSSGGTSGCALREIRHVPAVFRLVNTDAAKFWLAENPWPVDDGRPRSKLPIFRFLRCSFFSWLVRSTSAVSVREADEPRWRTRNNGLTTGRGVMLLNRTLKLFVGASAAHCAFCVGLCLLSFASRRTTTKC